VSRSSPARQPLAVTFLIERLTEPGGSERQCVELARALRELGHRVSIVTLEGSLDVHEQRPIDLDIPVIRAGASAFAGWIGKLHPKLGQAWEMTRLGLASRRLARTTLLMPHHYPAQWASFVATMFSPAPVVWLCNDWMYQPLLPGRTRHLARKALRACIIALDGFIARRCSAVLVLSCITGEAVDRGYRIRSRVFRTGASGWASWPASEQQRGSARQALKIPDSVYLVSTVCILMPHRRVEDVIRALARLPERFRDKVHFIHLGGAADHGLRQTLESLATAEGVTDRVSFFGSVPEKIRRQVIEASDVFVFPVEGQSWGLAPIEAMAAGVPTIISAASGVSEVLRNGREVLVYEPGQVDRLAQLITQLHEEPQEARKLAQRGFRRWKGRFTWQRAARRLVRQLSSYQRS